MTAPGQDISMTSLDEPVVAEDLLANALSLATAWGPTRNFQNAAGQSSAAKTKDGMRL